VKQRAQRQSGTTRRDVLGAALGLALFGPGHAAAATAFTRDRAGRILVGLQLDGRRPLRFLLDTGAEISAISAFLARET